MMHKIFILYNVLFLLVGGGNIVYNLHYLQNHQHVHESHAHNEKSDDCEKCILYQSNNNYLFDASKLDFSNNYSIFLLCSSQSVYIFDFENIYPARSPPII